MIHLEFNTIFLFLYFFGEKETPKKQCIALPKEKRNINFFNALNFFRVSLRYVTFKFFFKGNQITHVFNVLNLSYYRGNRKNGHVASFHNTNCPSQNPFM